ncbi:MAG: phosphatase PAP2 family protein [bacterium]
MRTLLKPVDRLSLGFIALLASITLFSLHKIPDWKWLLSRYVLLSLSVVALAFYYKKAKSWKPARYLYIYSPAILVLVIFDSLGDLIPPLWDHYFDDVLIRIDYAMFGVHPTVWFERFIHPAFTSILQLAYITYYPMAITLATVLLMRKKYPEFDESVFGVILCFYLSYLGYILVPAVGPRFTLTAVQTAGLQADSLTRAIQETLNVLEHNKTDAFPSGHTAIALVTLFYAWKSGEKTLGMVLIPAVFGLIFSTVYLRYHYVIDVIAGILLAAGTIVAAPAIHRIFSFRIRPADAGEAEG